MVKRTMAAALMALVAATIVWPSSCSAWGGYTHQEISLEALGAMAETLPGARRILREKRLLDAYLGASMAPDMGMNFWLGLKDEDLHDLFHREDFASALLEVSRGDAEATAKALGWLSHIVADRSAHGDGGYSNVKKPLPLVGHTGLNHIYTEAMLDILALEKGSPVGVEVALDVDAVVEAAGRVGVNLDPARAVKVSRRFERSVAPAKGIFRVIGAVQRSRLVPDLERWYADARAGIVDGMGMNRAVTEVVLALSPHLEPPLEGEDAASEDGGAVRRDDDSRGDAAGDAAGPAGPASMAGRVAGLEARDLPPGPLAALLHRLAVSRAPNLEAFSRSLAESDPRGEALPGSSSSN